jgi:tetratricopeptide (TPR) repeat protein
MIWIIILIVIAIFVIVIKVINDNSKDEADLQGDSLDKKFSVIVNILNEYAFNGKGEIHAVEPKTKWAFNLYDGGSNQIIKFLYLNGNLLIEWRYKYFQKEVVHKKRFDNVRNLSIFEQQKIANTVIEEMSKTVNSHKTIVLNPIINDIANMASDTVFFEQIKFKILSEMNIQQLKQNFKTIAKNLNCDVKDVGLVIKTKMKTLNMDEQTVQRSLIKIRKDKEIQAIQDNCNPIDTMASIVEYYTLEYLNELKEESEKEVEELLQEGIRELKCGDVIGADVCFHRALKLRPNNAKIYYYLGICWTESKKLAVYEKGLGFFKKAIQINPDYIDAYLKIGDCYCTMNQFEEALIYYQKVLNINPNIIAYNNIGHCYISLKQYANAIPFLLKAQEMKSDATVLTNLGVCYFELKQPQKAMKYYKEAIAENKDYYHAYYNMGNTFLYLKQYDYAIDCYEKVVHINPAFMHVYYALGECYYEMGEFDKAIVSYQKNLEKYERAHSLVKKLEIKPNFDYIYNRIGECYASLGNFDKALMSFKSAVEINPNYYISYLNMGNCYDDLKQCETAIKCYNKAIALNPDIPDAYNELGICYRKLKQYENSIKTYKTSIKINPDNAAAYHGIGVCYANLNQFNDAIDFFRKSMELDASNANTAFYIGMCYSKMDNYDEAIKYIEKASSLGHPEAQKFIHKIRN